MQTQHTLGVLPNLDKYLDAWNRQFIHQRERFGLLIVNDNRLGMASRLAYS